MAEFDISPELQREVINLMLAALNRGRIKQGLPGANVEHFDVSPELQRQVINALQAFAKAMAASLDKFKR
jgi:hypothetical protein